MSILSTADFLIPTNSTSNSVSPRYRRTDLGLKYGLYCSGLGTVKMYERVKVKKNTTDKQIENTRKHSNRVRSDRGSGLHSRGGGGRGIPYPLGYPNLPGYPTRDYPTPPPPEGTWDQRYPTTRKDMGPEIPYPLC